MVEGLCGGGGGVTTVEMSDYPQRASTVEFRTPVGTLVVRRF